VAGRAREEVPGTGGTGLTVGRRDSGQARGGASARAVHAEHVAHVTRDRGLASAEPCLEDAAGKGAERQGAQAHYTQQEGERGRTREAGSVEFGLARSCQEADV
jgi:hypothetical protein